MVCLDSPGSNYRAVWAMHKNYPGVKIYVRAHDVGHGINLEKAGATAVIPEVLEPSLQVRQRKLGWRACEGGGDGRGGGWPKCGGAWPAPLLFLPALYTNPCHANPVHAQCHAY